MAHPQTINAMDLAPNGRYLVTAAGYAWYLWDLQTGRELYRHTGHTGIVNDVRFSPDGQYVITASADGTARTWLVGAADLVK
jgi:WD40 repeat protein